MLGLAVIASEAKQSTSPQMPRLGFADDRRGHLLPRRLAAALDCSHGEKLVKLYVYSMIVAFR